MIWATLAGFVAITALAISAIRSDPYKKSRGGGDGGGDWLDGGGCGDGDGGGCD